MLSKIRTQDLLIPKNDNILVEIKIQKKCQSVDG